MEFLETKLLVAALNGDKQEALRLIAKMLPNERAKLQAAMRDIDDWIDLVEIAEEGGE